VRTHGQAEIPWRAPETRKGTSSGRVNLLHAIALETSYDEARYTELCLSPSLRKNSLLMCAALWRVYYIVFRSSHQVSSAVGKDERREDRAEEEGEKLSFLSGV
jgi:hypothetical protein